MMMARGITRTPTAISATARDTIKVKVVLRRARFEHTTTTTSTFPSTEATAMAVSMEMYIISRFPRCLMPGEEDIAVAEGVFFSFNQGGKNQKNSLLKLLPAALRSAPTRASSFKGFFSSWRDLPLPSWPLYSKICHCNGEEVLGFQRSTCCSRWRLDWPPVRAPPQLHSLLCTRSLAAFSFLSHQYKKMRLRNEGRDFLLQHSPRLRSSGAQEGSQTAVFRLKLIASKWKQILITFFSFKKYRKDDSEDVVAEGRI